MAARYNDFEYEEPPRRSRARADVENGPSEKDIPQCPRCGRWPGDGVSFLRPEYLFGDECDRCAQRLASPRDTATRRARRDVIDAAQPTYADRFADDEPPATTKPSGGYAGLWAARDLRATVTTALVIERHTKESGEYTAKGWLARLTLAPFGSRYEFDREFVGQSSSSKTGRSELREYEVSTLADGIYEADTVGRDGANKRLFFKVEGGRIAVVFRGRADAKVALRREG